MSTASRLEITLKSKIRYGLLVMSAFPASVPDGTEVVPPKGQKPIHRRSMPFPLIDDEPQKSDRSAGFDCHKKAPLDNRTGLFEMTFA